MSITAIPTRVHPLHLTQSAGGLDFYADDNGIRVEVYRFPSPEPTRDTDDFSMIITHLGEKVGDNAIYSPAKAPAGPLAAGTVTKVVREHLSLLASQAALRSQDVAR